MISTFSSRLRNFFAVPSDNIELLRAQYRAFSKQIPLLYCILVANMMAVSYTFVSLAPYWLSLYIPAFLCLLCGGRAIWWFRQRHDLVPDQRALERLQTTNRLTPVLAAVFVAWGLSLFRYGTPYAQSQVAFFLALTVIGCIFCLMHLRSAAFMATVVVNVPCILYFLLEGTGAFRAIAANLAIVCAAMMSILRVHYQDFANLAESRRSLIEKQMETQLLSDENLRIANENFRIANLDSLTDLPNRRAFFALLEKEFALAKSHDSQLALGILDLDGFKPINDTYGHVIGDKVLVEVSQRLLMTCGPDISVARLGGDEFALIISRSASDASGPIEDDLIALGTRIGDTLRIPYSVAGNQALLAGSIGFATFPGSASSPASLYERADYALYHAKRHARGQTVLFSTEHEDQIKSYSLIEQALHNADLVNELSLVFQPIVEAKTGRPIAFECLARWTSPTLGKVSPDRFIPVAERSGLICSITHILLKKALAAVAKWPDEMRISFNLSAHDISSAESIVQIIALLNQSGVDPKRLDFEITETSVAYDFQQAHAAVVAFKALGAGISLDDFGTGYSSLSHVHRLPLSKIKVDRSFVIDINTNTVSHKIVKSLTALCADMGLACVAEGVETQAQLDTLNELGCGMIQGYHFSRPLMESAVQEYLDTADWAKNTEKKAPKGRRKTAA